MKHIPVLAATLTFLAAAMSCSGPESTSGAATVDAAAAQQGASAAKEEVVAEAVEEPKPDTVLTYALTSAQDALDFMRNSQYAARYDEGILPAMAKDNLDYTERLLRSPFNYFIVVDKPSMFVVLYDRFGREQKAYKMACSKRYGTKHKRRDNRTPEGFFSAEGVYDSTDWLYTNDDGYTSPVKGQFGPRFIRLKTDVTRQVGIHGTCAPGSLGRRASHGCIRIHNDNILELVKYVTVGMPIIVNPSAQDQKVNREEGYTVPSVNIGKPERVQTPKPEEKASADSAASKPSDLPADTTVRADSTAASTPATSTVTETPSEVESEPEMLD